MDDNTRKIELARRAVACKHWRWMPGMAMLDQRGEQIRVASVRPQTGDPFAHDQDDHRDGWLGNVAGNGYLADLDDPATQGCFERGLIPEAYSVEPDGVSVWIDMRGVWWLMLTPLTESRELACPVRATRSEALVNALEAAPGGGS